MNGSNAGRSAPEATDHSRAVALQPSSTRSDTRQPAGLTPTQRMILQLQRTAGNTAVNALLRQYAQAGASGRGEGTAPAHRGSRPIVAQRGIGDRVKSAVADAGASQDAEPVPARAQVTGGPEGAVIQRKLVFAQDRFKNLTSIKAAADASTFVQIKDKYAEYVKMDGPAQEVLAMRQMKSLIETWQGKNGSSTEPNDLIKQQLLKDLNDAIQLELPKATTRAHKWYLSREIGLPVAYLDTLQDADVGTLGKASKALGRGDVPAADQHLTLLRNSIGDVVNLIKSSLLSRHIGTVDPEMAKALGDPEYKLGKKDQHVAEKAMTRVKDLAAERLNTAGDSEKADFGDAFRDMRGTALGNQTKSTSKDLKGLIPAEATAIFGYTTPVYAGYSDPLRKDLGTNQVDESKKALTKTTLSGLNKLKPVKATLFRHLGFFPGFKELNQVGATVSDMGFMSSTKDQGAAGTGGKAHDVLEIIESKTGRDVAGLSMFPAEMEVLFKPATRFQITKRFDWDTVNPRNEKGSWKPVLDDEAAKYLQADVKDTILQMIVFKKEI